MKIAQALNPKFFAPLILLCALLSGSPGLAMESVGFHLENDSQLGAVVVTGNSPSRTYWLSQVSTAKWPHDVVRLDLRYLRYTWWHAESAKNYLVGLRYERALSQMLNAFVAQNIEGDIYKGFKQRYNTDVGFKRYIRKEMATKAEDKDLNLFFELGYRYSHTNLTDGSSSDVNFARLYGEVEKYFSPTLSAKYWVEVMPNLERSRAYRFNTEISVSSALNTMFSLKTGFLLRHDNEPGPWVAFKTDTVFSTALSAKF